MSIILRRGAVTVVLACLLAALTGRASLAQEASPTPVLTESERADALKSVRSLIRAHYVFVELRAPLVAALDASEAEGLYDLADPDQFAGRVTEDFRRVANDGHLYLRRDPARYRAMLSPPDADEGLEALQRRRALLRNHGLTEQRVLPGGLRYLKLEGFDWVPDGSTARAYDQAAVFLAGGEGVIVDLRGNGGGHSEAADYFRDHVLAAVGRPVYLLVDGGTGSAAEAVAYDAKIRGRARIVGARTYGAANNVRHFAVAPDLVLSLSYNRPVHPVTGTNWEGVGVEPDIGAPGQALEAAQLEALEQLADRPGADPEALAVNQWRQAGLRAALNPPVHTAQDGSGLVGRYGAIEIRMENGDLRLYRADRPRWPQGARLKAMTDDGLFAMEGTDDLRFRFNASGLQILRPGAAPEPFERLP